MSFIYVALLCLVASVAAWVAGKLLGFTIAIDARNVSVVRAYLVLFIAVVAINVSANAVFPAYVDDEIVEVLGGWGMWPSLVVLGLFVPFAEEFIFRGFLIGAARKFLSDPASALIAALLWTAIHYPYSALVTPFYIAYGYIYGMMAIRSGSLFLPIALHAAINIFSVCELHFQLARA